MGQLIKIGIPRHLWNSDRSHPWYSDIRIKGHRIRRVLSIYRPRAQKMLDDLKDLRRIQRHGGHVENLSWYTFREKFLGFMKRGKPTTYYHYTLAIRRLEEAFPALQNLSQITPDSLEAARLYWEQKKIRPYAIAKAMRCLKRMMKKAEEWKFVPPQNWRSVKVKKDRKRVIWYTVEQFQEQLSHCTDHWKTAALLMGRAGLRPEEVRYLEWPDINFKDRIIHIRIKEHLDWKPKKSTEDSPHERVVDMPADLEAHLESIQKQQGFVLGEFIKYHTFRQYFQRLPGKCEPPFKGFAYAFRHTYASHLISHGATLSEVGDLLGHTDYRSTQIYAHMMPHARRSAVDRLPPI